MAVYSIELTPRAARELKKLDRDTQKRLSKAIDGLSAKPRPHSVETLTGYDPPVLRIRSGNYRILYQVNDKSLVVLVIRMGHRRAVYR